MTRHSASAPNSAGCPPYRAEPQPPSRPLRNAGRGSAMSNAAKGLGLLLVVVAVALGGWWLMADHSPAPIVAQKGAAGGSGPGEGDFATPAPVDAANPEGLAAQRATDAAPAAEAPAAAPGSTLPTAEYLTGMVVDPQGQPVAGADVRWGWPEFGALSRARSAR